MREIIQLVVSFTGSLGFAALFNIHGKNSGLRLQEAACPGCISGSGVHNAKSVCVRFLVNSRLLLCMQNVWQEFIKRR